MSFPGALCLFLWLRAHYSILLLRDTHTFACCHSACSCRLTSGSGTHFRMLVDVVVVAFESNSRASLPPFILSFCSSPVCILLAGLSEHSGKLTCRFLLPRRRLPCSLQLQLSQQATVNWHFLFSAKPVPVFELALIEWQSSLDTAEAAFVGTFVPFGP